MRSNALASALALAALAPGSPAAASLSDFRLPDERPQPQQPAPDLQGPVAPDVPASRRRPATPPPSPAVRADDPPATESAVPQVEIPAGLQAAPAATPSRPAAVRAPSQGPAGAASHAPSPEPAAPVEPVSAPVASSSSPPGTVSSPSALRARPGDWSWQWWLAAVPLLVAALGLAGWATRRRRPAGPVAAPRIERHRPSSAPASRASQPSEQLQVSLEPRRLALTLLNATLAYRLELANRGSTALTGLAIGADMISAHASLSREEQLSGPPAGNGSGTPLQRIDRIEPGESRVVEGEFRLPLPEIVPIRQGEAALLLPLARFRVEAEGAAPVVRTFVVGQPGQGKRLQPFRLDLGPRIYPHLAQHAFA